LNLEQFYQSRSPDWEMLGTLLKSSERGLETLSPEQVRRLGWLYRAATSDLALAHRDFRRQPVTGYLNQLVARAHAVIYQSEPLAGARIRSFAARGFPRAYRKSLPYTLAAAAAFLLPALLAAWVTSWRPEAAEWLLPGQVQALQEELAQGRLWTEIPVQARPYAASFIMQNNIQVAILAFGSGVLAGLLTLWILAFNGLVLGGVCGLTIHYGLGFELLTFVIGHGVIELSVVILAGAAGLRLGWSILSPGFLRRRDALALAAPEAVRLLLGGIPLLVIAGLIEGFLSPAEGVAWPVKWGVGLGSGALLYGYLLLAGRGDEAQPRSEAHPAFELQVSVDHGG